MNQKGFSQIILLGIIAVLILAGAGRVLVFREKKVPSSEKMVRQEISFEDVTSPIEPTPTPAQSIQPSKPKTQPELKPKSVPPPSPTMQESMPVKKEDKGPVLKNLGVSFEPWDKNTNRAGAFIFLQAENKVFLEYGVEVASSEGGTKILPTFEYRTAYDADVFAAMDGVVTNVIYHDRTQDYAIHIQPALNSPWILEHDHVSSLKISKGNAVKAGDILGKAGTLGGDLGRTEIMFWNSSGVRPTTYCPFKYFDPQLLSEYRQKVLRHMKDWEEFKGNPNLYSEEKHIFPGCIYETLLD